MSHQIDQQCTCATHSPNHQRKPRLDPGATSFPTTYPISPVLDTITETIEPAPKPSKPSGKVKLPPSAPPARLSLQGPPKGFKPAPPTRPIRIINPPSKGLARVMPPGSTYPHTTPNPNPCTGPGPTAKPSLGLAPPKPKPSCGFRDFTARPRPSPPPPPTTTHSPPCPLAATPYRSSTSFTAQPHRPSTTFYIGPIPPVFGLHELLQAIYSLSPRGAMFDMTSGIIQIEIPFDMNWQQVGEWCHRGLMIGSLVLPIRMSVSDEDN